MSISKTRSVLYTTARLLGAVSAARRGQSGKWLVRQLAGKATGRALGGLFR